MYVFAIRGGEADRALERLLPALDGRVATVRTGAAASDGGVTAARAATEYVLEGRTWRASGGTAVTGTGTGPGDADGIGAGDADGTGAGDAGCGRVTLRDALDRLAPDHDYAAVLGDLPDGTFLDVPTLAVGVDDASRDGVPDAADGEGQADVIAADAGDLPVDETVAVIEDAEPYETLESLVAAAKRSPDAEYAGAVATFTGRVRAKEDAADDRTRYLEFEKYEGVADRRMRRIERELEDRDDVLEVRLHHRTGRIADGDDIVFVVVLAGHRDEAFRTVEDGINRLKDEVPLFKKEVTEDETFWVHERET